MTAETIKNTAKTFKFSYPTCTNEDVLFKLEVPVEIPHGGSTRELVQRVMKMFHIPVYLEEDKSQGAAGRRRPKTETCGSPCKRPVFNSGCLSVDKEEEETIASSEKLNEKLAEFVADETKKFHNERDAKLLDQLKNSELNIEGIVKNWEKLFKENVIDFAEQKGSSDEEVFAAAYHKLVHSPALDTILQVEANYAKTVMNMLKNRDEDIEKLTQRQTEEMEEKMRLLNTLTTEEEINELAVQHFEQQSLAAGRWDSQLDALRHTQRAAHRAWLMTAINEYQTDEKITPSSSPLMSFPTELAPLPTTPRLEESFTIHLGSQLKQTHNIRLAALDMMHLCSVQNPDAEGGSWAGAQPALALYSGELSGAVLLADAMPSRSPLLRSARAAAEHHFPDVDAQLRHIAEAIKEPVEKRNAELQNRDGAGGDREQRYRYRGAPRLRAGDVFVTRHSNLADAHVVFHLVADDESLKSGDMTSRHPAILGLRNILKAACCNDVTSIAFPLLLKHELTEEMTAAWCMRRAELVLKCVKGFVLEASGGGGADLRTLCATLPPDIRPALFSSLAALLPTIFRVSGPVRAKTAAK